MQPFVWNQRFVTGLDTVDQQHRHLVDLINRVAILVIEGAGDEATIEAILAELGSYAGYHFGEEERLMAARRVDPRHVERHQSHHRQFIEQVGQMWATRDTLEKPAEVLGNFLSSWLTFHILEEDQAMARQVGRIAGGESPETAYEREAQPADNANAVLLAAMNNLYHVLTVQNQALADSNRSLEEKVATRTRELLQSEKMAAVGQLAAGVAHEINNPIGFVNSNLGSLGRYAEQLLQVIDAYAESVSSPAPPLAALLARTDLPFLRDDMVALLRESQEGLDRVKKIVQDLKDFSHASDSEWLDTDLLAGLESTLNVVWNEIKYKAEVIREFADLPPVRCIPGQINQVFMNLLVNAGQAIAEHGVIALRSGVEDGWIWIEVADSGCGMPPEVLKHVFEPFFTTKPVGSGTGLGLSVTWDIVVNKHAGRIDVKSEPGQGSAFRVWLPLKPAGTKVA
ncbi:MAG: bacteriohemerythrin [Sterolibacterium sp.]|jgi:hemerythrin-like metal-binding protein